jgi:DNA-binding FadR family transcriptional regulator
MERVGLVAQVEAELERVIALGMLPECGSFGSEEKLARSYGVSRTTVREALRRLAARGLVVQHPGRNTRARALDESLTLENLGLALHDERSPGSRRLLEGYFSLKRQVTVELLVDCAKYASEAALKQLGEACFILWDVACLKLGERCAWMEFELLKLAAQAIDRPGHLLLIQSLQRAFEGLAARVLPLVDCEALGQWADCAMLALQARDVETLQRKLLALLRACDKRVLGRLAPVLQEKGPLHFQHAEERPLGRPEPAAQEDAAFQALPTMEKCDLGRPEPVAEENTACEAHPSSDARGLGHPKTPVEMEDAVEARPIVEERVPGSPASAAEDAEAFEAHPIVAVRGPGCLAPASEGSLSGVACTNPSDCRTGCCASPPEGGSQPEPASVGPGGPTRVVALGEVGSPPGSRSQPPPPCRRAASGTSPSPHPLE